MQYLQETPYSAAGRAAYKFLSENVCPLVVPEDILIPAPVFEISAPIGVRYGVKLDESAVNDALKKNMPTFDDINVFRGAYVENGYVNLGVSDEFMLRFAEIIADALPMGEQDDPILLPDDASYARARLRNYAAVNKEYLPSRAKKRALWLCFSLLEERGEVKQRRAKAAAVRACLDALPNDEGKFGGRAAAAMAALLELCD